MTRFDHPPGFYVYRLIDPRSGLPFYVGKGQGRRAWDHERLVRTGKSSGNARKTAVIQDLITFGHSVEVEIVASYDLESDALQHEWQLVDGNPVLTNVMPGGAGRIISPEEHERRGAKRRAELAIIRAAEQAAAVERGVLRRRSTFMKSAKNQRHTAEIDRWMDEFKNKRLLLRASSHRSVEAVEEAAAHPARGFKSRRRR